MMNFILASTYAALCAAVLLVLREARVASPVFWYQVALAIITVGTFFIVDATFDADVSYVFASFAGFIAFTLASVLTYNALGTTSLLSRHSRQPLTPDPPSVIAITVGIFVLSTLITILYYRAVGMNMSLRLIQAGAINEYSAARLAAYAGRDYFAPGYVNQFKNFLLPLSTAILAINVWTRGDYPRVAVLSALALAICFNLYALVGTGQRTYLAFASAATLFGASLLYQGTGKRLLDWKVVTFVAAMSAIFLLMTGKYQGTGGGISEMFSLSFRRIIFAQQWAGLEAFRYIYDQPVAWYSEWGQSLMGMLPGSSGSTLANEVHYLLFGSAKGTAPPTVVGSAFHNGGYVGVVTFFTLLGVAAAGFYARYLRGPRMVSRAMTYGAMFFYLSSYVVGSPKYLFDNGVVTFLLLSGVMHLLRSARARAGAGKPSFRPSGQT